MLQITKEVQDLLSQKHFFDKLAQFLLERTQHPVMLRQLGDKQYLDQLWLPYWHNRKNNIEYVVAVTLTYILAIDCEKENVSELLFMAEQSNDPIYLMKRYFSRHQYLRLSEFDI